MQPNAATKMGDMRSNTPTVGICGALEASQVINLPRHTIINNTCVNNNGSHPFRSSLLGSTARQLPWPELVASAAGQHDVRTKVSNLVASPIGESTIVIFVLALGSWLLGRTWGELLEKGLRQSL